MNAEVLNIPDECEHYPHRLFTTAALSRTIVVDHYDVALQARFDAIMARLDALELEIAALKAVVAGRTYRAGLVGDL